MAGDFLCPHGREKVFGLKTDQWAQADFLGEPDSKRMILLDSV